ncbi:hypothetical protein IFR05_009762 [Cadophora sp. M221]|nr:hypothetical protein IFR05_009762 [Cadophora sp. M221]
MDKSKVNLANKILTLTASPSSGEKPASSSGKSIPVKYRSGTVHAKEKFSVSRTGGYDFVADFQATTTKGTWPPFWLTAVNGWPPEIDLAEWKGSGKISFNTFTQVLKLQREMSVIPTQEIGILARRNGQGFCRESYVANSGFANGRLVWFAWAVGEYRVPSS